MTDCQVCSQRVPGPLTLCWSCAALAGDALVFIRRPETAAEHERVQKALGAVLPSRPRSEDLSLAARGHKAVALVPMDESERVRALFRAHDVEVRVLDRSSARAPLPVGLKLVVGLTLIAGVTAGLFVNPGLIATGPMVAALLWASAQRTLRHPLAEVER